MMDQQQYKRKPAVERKINKVNQEDIRVKIIGRVIDKKENIFLLDDGTGTAEVMYDPEMIKKTFNINDLIKLFARVLLSDGKDVQLQAEAIQNINDLNLDLYKRIMDVIENV